MSDKTLVLLEVKKGQISGSSWECLGFAQQLAAETGTIPHALLFRGASDPEMEKLSSIALRSVIRAAGPGLEEYSPERYSEALRQVIETESPSLVLMPHSYQNLDWVPRLAASRGLALLTECTGYRAAAEELIFSRQVFRSKLNADIRIRADRPWLITVQAGAYSSDGLVAGSCPVREVPVDLAAIEASRSILETVESIEGKVDLAKAEVIIGVGRGIKKKENLELVRELASVLNAELGASRPVVDNEWLERERQIGSSGQSVAPRLYIAVGISGAIQHVVGIRNADCIVAINSDPYAPIFNVATYGVLGDLQEIVPVLTRKLSEA